MTAVPSLGKAPSRPHPTNNKGAALLVMLFLILAAFSTIIVSQLSKVSLEAQRQKKTLEALAQAKQALVAWSVLQGDLGEDASNRQRPGTLPCPSFDDQGNVGSSCAFASATMPTIGRLPWKALGVGPLRDANGELLWYAVSNSFRRPGLTNAPINSDSIGTLLLFAADGISTLTPAGEELVAVIFSSGEPLPGQTRSAASNAADDYLDSGRDRNNKDWSNSAAAGPFVLGPVVNSQGDVIVNDIALGISARELISNVENRALKEAQKALEDYRLTKGTYPNAAKSDAPNCVSKKSSITNGDMCAQEAGVCFGRFPEDLSGLALWFQQNAWGRVLTYALSDGVGCTGTLSVNGTSKPYVIIAPGTERTGQTRPSATLADYLEDSANNDTWGSDPDFSTPTSIANDQLRTLP